jgi:RNA polymerase sigma-70 factor (ECF subfamily)
VRLTGDPAAAEDVVHDAVVRAARGWQGFRGEAAFSTWWTAIVINVWRDRLRARRANDESATLADDAGATAGDSVVDVAAAAELGRLVAAAVSRLPPRQREVLVLVAYEGLSIPQAAGVLGLTEGNVRTTLFHARARLRQVLARYLDPPDKTR